MSKVKTINASLLIVGTSIGAGMLGLPVETGRGGFFPSVLFLVLNWLVMTGTALLLVELFDKNKSHANFISLSEKILGQGFKVLTFVVYIGLFISLTLAYVKGGGVFLADLIDRLPVSIGCLFFLVALVPLVVLGSKILSIGNSVLTFALMCSFLLLIALGISKINPTFMKHVDWKLGWLSLGYFAVCRLYLPISPNDFSGHNSDIPNEFVLPVFFTVVSVTLFCAFIIFWGSEASSKQPYHGFERKYSESIKPITRNLLRFILAILFIFFSLLISFHQNYTGVDYTSLILGVCIL